MGRHESVANMSSLRDYSFLEFVFHGFTPMATTCRHFVAKSPFAPQKERSKIHDSLQSFFVRWIELYTLEIAIQVVTPIRIASSSFIDVFNMLRLGRHLL